MTGSRPPLEAPTAEVARIPLSPTFGRGWWLAIAVSAAGVAVLAAALVWLLWSGVGIWGNSIPYVWGFDLTNYIWWIGIANGTSLFAAILVLRRHSLRTSINRFAEGCALFAVACAGLFPIIHLGRPWLFHWVFPYPPTFAVWPQFRSPLTWDFWAISTHAIVTSLLWYVGLVPDLATLRDRARGWWAPRIYAILALGWRGSARQWAWHQRAHRLVAVLVLPLVVVMQSAVAFELASTIVPDWHEPRQPLHFVVTGLASGLAVVLLAAVALRRALELDRFIDDTDIDLTARLLMAAALVVGFVYLGEIAVALIAAGPTRVATLERMTGPYAVLYWGAIALTVLVPQVLWLRRWRTSAGIGILAAVSVGLGVWLDRLSIVVAGIRRDHLPSMWGRIYHATLNEWLLLAGSLALFAALFLLFVRFLPVISLFETRHEEVEERLP